MSQILAAVDYNLNHGVGVELHWLEVYALWNALQGFSFIVQLDSVVYVFDYCELFK